MKIVSWNVNGLNSTIAKGFDNFLRSEDADIYCLQEIKVSEKTIDKKYKFPENYEIFWNKAEKNGYSGVMMLTKEKPLSIQYGLNNDTYNKEGRLIIAEYENFYLFNLYVPNAGRDLSRIEYKLGYNQELYNYCEDLKEDKNIILCGDLNVAHKEIDLKNPTTNSKTAGFTIEERKSFTKLLDLGYIDTFREFKKDGGHYTWWSYRNQARLRNIGWRLDYFVINSNFKPQIKNSEIMPEILGSDHCPIRLTL